jgi:hypothetical protein
MDYDAIYEWNAQRAGSGLTITGRRLSGAPCKVTNVQYIAAEGGEVIATTATGNKLRLSLDRLP